MFFEAGGMPSSHSALVCSSGMMMGFTEGFDSVLFAAAAVFAAIVMYDAIKVRHEEVVHTLHRGFGGGGLSELLSQFFPTLFLGVIVPKLSPSWTFRTTLSVFHTAELKSSAEEVRSAYHRDDFKARRASFFFAWRRGADRCDPRCL